MRMMQKIKAYNIRNYLKICGPSDKRNDFRSEKI